MVTSDADGVWGRSDIRCAGCRAAAVPWLLVGQDVSANPSVGNAIGMGAPDRHARPPPDPGSIGSGMLDWGGMPGCVRTAGLVR